MPISLVGSTNAGSSDGGNSVTSSALDTTGANLLVVAVVTFGAGTTPTDSKGNTWTGLTVESGSSNVRLWYCLSPTVGTGHTFSHNSTGTYPAIQVFAFSGVDSFESQSGFASSYQPGSLTPAEDGALLVSTVASGAASSGLAVDSSFIGLEFTPNSAGQHVPGGTAYKIQTTAGAENPTWSWPSSSPNAVTMAVFKPSATVLPLVAGTASFVSSGPGGIALSATAATGGVAPYTRQWQRNTNGGSYSNLSGATSLTVTDTTATAGNLYGYRVVYTDSATPTPSTVTGTAVFAQLYTGGSIGAGGVPRIGPNLIGVNA
jgi:hypothetical protein